MADVRGHYIGINICLLTPSQPLCTHVRLWVVIIMRSVEHILYFYFTYMSYCYQNLG